MFLWNEVRKYEAPCEFEICLFYISSSRTVKATRNCLKTAAATTKDHKTRKHTPRNSPMMTMMTKARDIAL